MSKVLAGCKKLQEAQKNYRSLINAPLVAAPGIYEGPPILIGPLLNDTGGQQRLISIYVVKTALMQPSSFLSNTS